MGSYFLRPERRNANRNLDQFVEIISGKIVIHAVKMLADSMFDHVGIGRDHERRVLQEQEQPYRFEGGNGGWWQAPVDIADAHDQSDTEFFHGFLTRVTQFLDCLWEIRRSSCRARVTNDDYNPVPA